MNIQDVSLFVMKSMNSKEIHGAIKQELPFFDGDIIKYLWDNINSLRKDEWMKAMGVTTTKGIVLFWKKNKDDIEKLVKEGLSCKNSLFGSYKYSVIEETNSSFPQYVINQVKYAACFDVTRKILNCLLKKYPQNYALYHRLAGTFNFMDGGGVKAVDSRGIRSFFEGLDDVTNWQRMIVKSLELKRKEAKKCKELG